MGIEKEIIVVDDDSKDNTFNLLKQQRGIILIKHEKNKGKGGAMRTGLNVANGDIITFQDADLEYDPNDYKYLIKILLEEGLDIVYGSRFLGKKFKLIGKEKIILPFHWLGNHVLSLVTSTLFGQKITDMETGYKMFRKEVIKNLNLRSNRFEIEPEITAKILKRGYKIKEVPISYNPRNFSEGKKITIKDGLLALFYLIKYRFVE